MGAGHQERPDQQRGHAPEGIEQEWISFRIVVRGVSQISGELPMGSAVTLRAGLHDIIPAQARADIGYWENVVRSMTVVTLGGRQIPELRHLAMKGLEITRGDGLVTSPALVHDMKPEIRQVGALNAVSGMAFVAYRQFLGRVRDFGRVNALGKHLEDAPMTFRAGLRDVGPVDAGGRIAARQLAVSRVAVRAVGRHGEPAFQQPLAVYALGVVLQNLYLRAAITNGRFLASPVTSAAKRWHISRESG